MEVDHKDAVDQNYMLFTELLRHKSIPLVRYLYDEQILTERTAKETMSLAAHTLRTMHLLDNLMEVNKENFNTLYAAILYAKLWKAADILEPKKRPHQDIYDAPKIPLPKEWPHKEYFKELENKELEIKPVDPKDAIMKEWYEESTKNNVYEMRQETKGRVLIINNYKFAHPSLKDRLGSDKDVERLENIFKKLGFEPEAHPDLTCKQMTELLRKEAKRDHSKYNCFFLIIMSHGHKGVVYGTDGYRKGGDDYVNCLYIEAIKDQFYHVKSLERKPKVFIIEACQGSFENRGIRQKVGVEEDDDNDDEGDVPVGPTTQTEGEDPINDGAVEVDDGADLDRGTKHKTPDDDGDDDDDENDDEENDLPVVPTTLREGGDPVDDGHKEDDEEDSDSDEDDEDEQEEEDQDDRRDREPELGDDITAEAPYHFLVAVATTEGNYAYLNTAYGSWFIQAIIFVIAKYAWKEDLQTLMEKVNQLLRRARTETSKYKPMQYFQVSEIKTYTFTKRLFFFPGMPLETPPQTTKTSKPLSKLSLPTF